MSDLISRDEAFEIITDFAGKASTKSAYSAFWKSAKSIQSMSTIDAIPVVHCKDCKYLGIKDLGTGYCKGKMCGIVRPDSYCSYGEMRKDGEK